MGTAKNKKFVTYYFEEVWNKGNIPALNDILAPNYLRYISPMLAPLNVDQQIVRMNSIRSAFPDIQIQIKEIIINKNMIAVRAEAHGTHLGNFLGIPPTRKEICFSALEVIGIENGKFTEHWGGPNSFDILRQLETKTT